MRLFAGQSAWVLQRLSALVLLVLLALGTAALLMAAPGFAGWRALATSPHGAVLIVIGFVALCVHGWIGARDVVLDYVHAPRARLLLLALVGTLLIGVLTRVVLTLTSALATAA